MSEASPLHEDLNKKDDDAPLLIDSSTVNNVSADAFTMCLYNEVKEIPTNIHEERLYRCVKLSFEYQTDSKSDSYVYNCSVGQILRCEEVKLLVIGVGVKKNSKAFIGSDTWLYYIDVVKHKGELIPSSPLLPSSLFSCRCLLPVLAECLIRDLQASMSQNRDAPQKNNTPNVLTKTLKDNGTSISDLICAAKWQVSAGSMSNFFEQYYKDNNLLDAYLVKDIVNKYGRTMQGLKSGRLMADSDADLNCSQDMFYNVLATVAFICFHSRPNVPIDYRLNKTIQPASADDESFWELFHVKENLADIHAGLVSVSFCNGSLLCKHLILEHDGSEETQELVDAVEGDETPDRSTKPKKGSVKSAKKNSNVGIFAGGFPKRPTKGIDRLDPSDISKQAKVAAQKPVAPKPVVPVKAAIKQAATIPPGTKCGNHCFNSKNVYGPCKRVARQVHLGRYACAQCLEAITSVGDQRGSTTQIDSSPEPENPLRLKDPKPATPPKQSASQERFIEAEKNILEMMRQQSSTTMKQMDAMMKLTNDTVSAIYKTRVTPSAPVVPIVHATQQSSADMLAELSAMFNDFKSSLPAYPSHEDLLNSHLNTVDQYAARTHKAEEIVLARHKDALKLGLELHTSALFINQQSLSHSLEHDAKNRFSTSVVNPTPDLHSSAPSYQTYHPSMLSNPLGEGVNAAPSVQPSAASFYLPFPAHYPPPPPRSK